MHTLHRLQTALAAFRHRALACDPRRLVVAFAATVLVAIWTFVLCQVHFDRVDAIEEWTGNLGNLTRAFEEHTLRGISAVDQDVRFVRNQYLREGEKLDLIGLDKQDGINAAIYNQIGVLDARGDYILSNVPSRRVNAADRDYFRFHRENGADDVSISVPMLGRNSGRWSVQLSRRMSAVDGSFIGVVVASIDPSYLGSLYNDVNLGENSIVTLVGTDGLVRARRGGGRFSLGDDLSGTLLFTAHGREEAGAYIAAGRLDGIARLYTFRKVPGYPLRVVIAVPLQHIYERSNERRDGFLALAAVATLIIVLFARLILQLLREQARTVEDLRASREQAESANRLKSEFLANMSHELRTPLNGILGFADVLGRKCPDEKSRRQAQIIHTSGKHLLTLLNSILDLAKVEAGKMDLYIKAEELAPFIEATARLHEIIAAAKGLALRVSIEAGVPAQLWCDATLLRQVLENLISNAIKFTERGEVNLRVRVEAARPEVVFFSVSDTGIGIAPAALHLVFEKFRQVDGSATRAHQGTGLGLTLVKNFVELMGGRVEIDSVFGAGTTVAFTLPARPAAAPRAAAPPQGAATAKLEADLAH